MSSLSSHARLGSLALVTLLGCATSPDEPDPEVSPDGKADGAGIPFVVNGHTLNAREQQWMRYVATRVIPELPGTLDRRIEIASRTAWWSLKEGIFDTSNAPKYSLCNSASGDHAIGPLEVCGSGRAWQVGLAAVQVPNHTLSELEQLAHELYPGQTVETVLAQAAAEAGLTGTTAAAVVASTGSLRKSWLLRRSALGFTACERNEVVPECIEGSLGWCYGTSWDTTARFAPTRSAAMRSIADIAKLLRALVAARWIGSPCDGDADCGFVDGPAHGYCLRSAGASTGFCSLPCEGYCPDRTGYGKTFCVEAEAGGGTCVARAGTANRDCADIPGTHVEAGERYLGSSSAPPATVEVCLPD